MTGRRLHIRRPSPATVLAVVALVFAVTGGAVAADKMNKDEVTVVNLTGGPVDTTAPHEDVTIPLTDESDEFTFTQKAGEAVELIATFDTDSSQATFCGMTAFVYGVDLPLQARPVFDFKSEAGELGEGSAIGGLAAPTEDREVTLRAIARETEDGCDEDVGEGETNLSDTWTVSVAVSIVTLRN
jgi:hypothetical protein